MNVQYSLQPNFTRRLSLYQIISSPLFVYLARLVILCLILASIIQAILFLRYGWGYVIEDMAFYYPPYVFLSHYAFYDFTLTIEKIAKILNQIHPPSFPLLPSKLPPHYVKFIVKELLGSSNVLEPLPSNSTQVIELSSSSSSNNSSNSRFKGNLFYSHTKVNLKDTSESTKKVSTRLFSIPKIVVSTSSGWILPEIPSIVLTTPKEEEEEEEEESQNDSQNDFIDKDTTKNHLKINHLILVEGEELTLPGSPSERSPPPNTTVNDARPEVPLTPRLKEHSTRISLTHSDLSSQQNNNHNNDNTNTNNSNNNDNNDHHIIEISNTDLNPNGNNSDGKSNEENDNNHKHNTNFIISSVLSTHPSIPTLSSYFSNTQANSDSNECEETLDVRYRREFIHFGMGIVSAVASSIIIFYLNEYKTYWFEWSYALELEYWIFWLMALAAFISLYFLKKVQSHLSESITRPFWISSSKAALISVVIVNSYPALFLGVYFLATKVIGFPQSSAWSDSESLVGLAVLVLIGVCVLWDANRDINFNFHYMVLYCTMIIAPRFFAYIAVTLYVSFGIDTLVVLLLWTIIIHFWLEFQQQICFRALHRQLSLPYLALSQCIDSITHHAYLAFTPLFQLSAFPIILLQIFIYLYRDISLLPYLTRKILNKFPIENDRHRVFWWSIEVQDKEYYVFDLLYAEQYFICDIFSLLGVVTFFWINGKQAQVALMASLRLVTFFISHLVKGWLSLYPDLLPFGLLLSHPSHWTKHSGFIFVSGIFSIVLICNNMQPALLQARL